MIYFIQAETVGYIKIGFTQNKESFIKRFRALKCANADTLKVLKTIKGGRLTEKALHAKHKPVRVRGEWFRPSPSLKLDIRSKKIKDLDYWKDVVKAKEKKPKGKYYPPLEDRYDSRVFDEVLDLFLDGLGENKITAKGCDRNLVRKVYKENESAIVKQRTLQKSRDIDRARLLLGKGFSIRAIGKDIGRSAGWIKTHLKL